MPMPYDDSGPLHLIEAACAASIGDWLQMDWATFGEEPSAVEWPESPGDAVVGAAFTLVAADVGTVAELEAASTSGDVATLMITESAAGGSDAAGSLWSDHLAEVVDRTVWDDDIAREAGFIAGVMRVDFAPDENADSLSVEEDPVYLASTLVHEASHSYGGHMDCGNGRDDCDADGTGAYGAQIRWLTSWAAVNAEAVSDYELLAVDLHVTFACSMILNPIAIPECADTGE